MQPGGLLYALYLAGMAIKGGFGLLQVAGGVALATLPLGAVARLAQWLDTSVVATAAIDPLALMAAGMLRDLSGAQADFYAAYFIVHGGVTVFVIAALLARRMWAYPLGMAVFACFLVYETYEYLHKGGLILVSMFVLDLMLIVLIRREWVLARQHRQPVL